MQLMNPSSWGPSVHGIPVVVNEVPVYNAGIPICLDIETDEADNFVGGCLYDGGRIIYYITDPKVFVASVSGHPLIGYNIKSDLHWLRGIGYTATSADILDDPMIMSYVTNSNRLSQGLKEVAKEELGWTWPSYRDMVGKGRTKKTLDRQAIEKVAEYCAMDTLATYRLWEKFHKTFNHAQKHLYTHMELPCYRMLWDMEKTGVEINLTKLSQLDTQLQVELKFLESDLHAYDSTWNPRSPQQTLSVLSRQGIYVGSSDKKTLEPFSGVRIVDKLLEHRRLSKLHSSYIIAFKQLKSLPIIHTTFNQVAVDNADGDLHGIRTGRLSSSKPNLQNIPVHGRGEELRELFVPRKGLVFIDADYDQIEYRLLAHFSQEPALLQTFHDPHGDVHRTTGQILGCNRSVGKTLNFASIYGAQAKKIAFTAKITEDQAQDFLDLYWQKLPKVSQWVNQVKLLAHGQGGVTTMAGRFIPVPDLKSKNKWKRLHAERAAVNYVIQGSASDIIKMAMIALVAKGHKPILQVHDELIFEVPPLGIKAQAKAVKQIMENVVTLSVPLKVSVGLGRNWREAKG